MQAHKAKLEVEKEQNGGFKKSKSKKKSNSKKAKNEKKNPFGASVLPNTSPESRQSVYRSRSPSLEAVLDDDQMLVNVVKQNEDAECELNISFSGGYVPNTDLSRVDKGLGNPQFKVDIN